MPECLMQEYDCPYCTPTGHCTLDRPEENCDDYMYWLEEEEEEE